jgi:adenine deaminase
MDFKLLEASLGKRPCDLVIRNCKIVDVFSCSSFESNIGIYRGIIAGFGDLDGKKEIDAEGRTIAPGFFDGHVHIESSMVEPAEFARAAVVNGTTSIVADPHEIANVLGLEGLRYMLDSSANLPLNIFFMLPSCVPSTDLETSGSRLYAEDLKLFLERDCVLGLGEVMNYHSLLMGSKKLMEELETFKSKRIDGHAPKLSGKELDAYCASGIESDHECVSADEAEEKLRKGLRIMIREGSAARNMKALLPVVEKGQTDRFILVTDDISALDLQRGYMNRVLSKAVSLGIKPEVAIRMATLNTCEYFRIESLGAIAPGYRADLVILKDTRDFEPEMVIKDGLVIAGSKRLLIPIKKREADVRATVNVKKMTPRSFDIKFKATDMKSANINVIALIRDEIETGWIREGAKVLEGSVVSDTESDILKVCVVERHRATGRVGKGFVRGFSLKSGAIASSVAHDSHNIIVVGADDRDMHRALEAVSAYGGGLVVVNKGKVLGALRLPIGGLMSDRSIEEVSESMQNINEHVASLGCELDEPFMTLSFLTVPVIPKLRVTDMGLIDVSRQKRISLFTESS